MSCVFFPILIFRSGHIEAILRVFYSGPPLLTTDYCSCGEGGGDQFALLSPGSIFQGNFSNNYPSALITLGRCMFCKPFCLVLPALSTMRTPPFWNPSPSMFPEIPKAFAWFWAARAIRPKIAGIKLCKKWSSRWCFCAVKFRGFDNHLRKPLDLKPRAW